METDAPRMQKQGVAGAVAVCASWCACSEACAYLSQEARTVRSDAYLPMLERAPPLRVR